MRLTLLSIATALLFALAPASAIADHSWGDYHWARTANPFPLQVGDNMSGGDWDALFTQTIGDWNVSSVLDMKVVAGSGGRNCKASSGRIEACNGKYGYNGWLGLAQIWVSGSHIVQATAKMNDSYLRSYKDFQRQHVLCQEIGHDFGLDHQDESGADLGTCMDYAESLDNRSPDAHDYEQLELIYAHTDSSNSFTTDEPTSGGGKGNGKGNKLKRVSDDLWVENLGNGRKRFVFVFWAQPGIPHGPPAGA